VRPYTFDAGERAATIEIDDSRDALLTDFGRATLRDRYLLPGESYQDLFARVACANSDEIVRGEDNGHAQRLYDAISQLWFMPATPVLTNSGVARGLPISCFLNLVGDSMESIAQATWENIWLAAKGGGIGTCWSPVRSINEPIAGSLTGKTSGIVPFIHWQDAQTLAISQGSCAVDPRPLPRCQPPRDRRVHHIRRPTDATVATRGARLTTCTTASSSPTRSWRRCSTRARTPIAPGSSRAPRAARSFRPSMPASSGSRSRHEPPGDRRALHHLRGCGREGQPEIHNALGLKVFSRTCARRSPCRPAPITWTSGAPRSAASRR
jgi:hypothetical protein